MLDKKPTRFIGQQVSKAPDDLRADLYGNIIGNVVFGSQSNSHYVDVISIGEIGGVEEVYLDDTAYSTGEFPDSTIYVHDGSTATSPWAGDFPYVERTIALSKNAEIQELGKGTLSDTTFTKSVSSLGVVGLRFNFTTSGFTHKDDQGREKVAQAVFVVSVIDPDGNEVKSEVSDYKYFSAKNPTAVQMYITPPTGYEATHWTYTVSMRIRGYYYGVNVSGIWAASTVTEVYKDTQTYENIAFSSGTIVASDVSGSIPERQYLASGYKVLIPTYQEIAGNQVLTGEYERATSNSHAWNALAVLTDTLWGGGLSLDKIDLVSFAEFEEYCAEEINGIRRFSYSQYLIKSDNYYKLASEIVGAADGRLYEDTSGRIGVLIDKQTDKRRVITSYDVVDEKVKRTTVSENSKTNYVQGTYDDEDNIYSSTIIFTEDSDSITANGLISEKLTLNTCTNTEEAKRTIKKVLTTSQYTTSSYVFKVGHTHEDIQIGEVVELYDRIYSNINYCGKVFAGSTTTTIVVDPRTPINLTGLKSPVFTIDNNRGVPLKRAISSWTDTSITLSEALPSAPAEFISFGVDDADSTGIKPTLIRVLGVDDTSGILSIEGVEYIDSLNSHVDYDTPLVTYKHRYIPDQQLIDIEGLYITQTLSGIKAAWDAVSGGYEYGYVWKVTPKTTNTLTLVSTGVATTASTSLPKPLEEGVYQIQVFPVLGGEQVGDPVVATLTVSSSGGSALPKPTSLVVVQDDGTLSDEYLGNSFKLQWTQQEESSGVSISHYKLRLSQNSLTKEIVLDGAERSYTFTSDKLVEYFGDYTREFDVELVAVDSDLYATAATQLTITNINPPVPNVTITDIGSIALSYSPSVPADVIGSRVYLWEGTDTSASIPTTAKLVTSSTPTGVTIPEGYVKTDGTPYVFDVRWIDGFGASELSARTVFSFNPDEQVPEIPELESVTPVDSQTVLVNFTHDGTYLAKMKVSYRRYGTSTWTELSEIFNIPSTGSNNGFDAVEGTGFIKVSGLVRNFNYEFKVVAANISSSYSADSEIIIGSPYLDTVTGDELENLTDLVDQFETDFKLRISNEVSNRKETDKALFDTAASAVQLRKDLAEGFSGFTDAIFEVDPSTGQIRNKAFAYTDDAFSQAGLLIDGVSAEVTIQAGRVTSAEDRITSAESEIAIQAGKIELKASYTEVNEIIAGAIDSIIPAYSFGFFNSTEGWSAVNGTITQNNNSVDLVFGDITNQALSYSADENPVISLSVERTAGTGWVGDLVVTFSGGTTKTFSGVIGDLTVGAPLVRVLNLSGESSYTGTVTGIRFVLGSSSSDTFNVTSISIGKPSAALESLEGITAQVNQLGIDIDAVEGSLTNYVTTAFYEDNSVTFSNLDVTLDGADAIISLKATQQELSDSGTIDKASSAAIWIDAAESNITQVVESYNAQPDGIDDHLEALNDQYTVVQSEIDAQLGLIRDQSVSINRLGNADKEIEKNGFYAAVQLLKQRDGLLEVGEAVATADSQLQALTDETSALALELTTLTASFGSELGQIDATFSDISTALASETTARVSSIQSLTASLLENEASIIDNSTAIATETTARTEAITQLTAQVGDDIALVDQSAKAAIGYCTISGNTSSHETKSACESAGGTWTNSTLASSVRTVQVSSGGNTATVGDFFESYIDLEGNVSGKAVLGVDINGAFTGMSVVGGNSFSKLTFKGNAVEFQTTAGVPALYWSSADDTWVFNGRLVVGGYTVDSEDDIRALDGDTIYEVYQYSVNGSTSWHTTYTTGDIYRRTATVTNGVQGSWSSAARITGLEGASGSNGYNNATVFLYQRSASTPSLPSATTTYTFATKTLTGVNNGWSQTIPSGTNPLYVTAATASATSATDSIASNEWASVSVMATDGEDGVDGANGLNSATVFLYKRSATASPTKPSAATTYTFSSGVLSGINNGWTQTVPTGTDPIYVITATAASTNSTDSIAASEWSTANVLAQNGSDGADGSNGVDGVPIVASVVSQFTGSTDGWIANQSTLTAGMSYATYTTTAADPNLVKNGINLVGNTDHLITMRVRCTSGDISSNRIDIFYVTSNHGFTGSYLKRDEVTNFKQGEWKTLTYDMRELTAGGSDWVDSTIQSIRIDLTNIVGATFEIDHISFGRYGAAVDGVEGASGAGLYGSTYSTISWTTATANSRFLALVGRNPVNLDVFTQTRIDGTDSQARQYNGSSWVTVALYVNGSIFAKNTVAGDVLIAGTEVNAPIINGGTLQMVGSTHMKYTSSTAFGSNSLIDWYGPKVNGVNWNTTTLRPIPAGMLKSNAITYLDANGEAYFGGSILAGTLRNAAQSTQKAQTVSVDTGVYGSNGGIITIKNSFSLSATVEGSGSCPTSSDPTSTLRLYKVATNGTETLVSSQVVTGTYRCVTEGAGNIQTYIISGSFTYTDTQEVTTDRRYKLSVTHDVPIASSEPESSQNLSIISEE